MRLVVCFACLSAISLCEGGAGSAFDEWASVHGRTYATAEEHSRRRAVFMANVELVHNLTASSTGDPEAARFVLNKFADLTPAEFQQTYRSGYKPVDVAPIFVEPTKFRLPTGETKVDWRTRHAVTKVYDQGTCGCCWAVSTIQAIESQWFIQKRGPLPSLSFQQVVREFRAK